MSLSDAVPPPLAESRTASIRAIAFFFLLLFAMSPIILVDIPAMVDYPNHLARMAILARAGTADPHPFYEVHWALYPNLAMDLIVPPFARWIGVEPATKLFYMVSQLLIVGGAMTLSYVVRGNAIAAGMIACLFLYAIPFAFGFVNFEFALGIALFAIAGWIKLANRPLWLRLAVHSIAVAILFMAHLFALGVYGFAIGVIELWRIFHERRPLKDTLGVIAIMVAPAAVLALVVAMTGSAVGGAGSVWNAGHKVFWTGLLNGWNRPFAFILTLQLLAVIGWLAARGWFKFTGPGRWLAIGFGALFVAMPGRFLDTGYVDGRVLIAAVLILPAFITAHLPDEGSRKFLWGLVACACLVNTAYSAWVQLGYRTEYARLLDAFDAIPVGSRVIAADNLEGNDPPFDLIEYPMHHAVTLAVYRRDAFVPTLFTYPGKQPLRPTALVEPLSVPEGSPIHWPLLNAYFAGEEPAQGFGYARNWWRDFDYLLMLHPDGTTPRPDLLEQVASGDRFTLFRIRTRAAR